MARMRRSRADCDRLRDLHAKAAGYPFPPAKPAHASANHGWTTHQDAVLVEDDGRVSYDLPTDAELGPVRLARLTGPERAEITAIRAKPET
jgi:hypothetical protein